MYSALNENNIMFEREKKFDDFVRQSQISQAEAKKYFIERKNLINYKK